MERERMVKQANGGISEVNRSGTIISKIGRLLSHIFGPH
jgi:hypothetical protein